MWQARTFLQVAKFNNEATPKRQRPRHRYLPFWAATLVDRLWIMLLPLIGLAIPLLKLVMPAYRWRIRRRLLRVYAELALVDPLSHAIQDDEDLSVRLQRLERIDSESVIESVPQNYADDVYKLRRDIDLVRRRLGAASGTSVQQS